MQLQILPLSEFQSKENLKAFENFSSLYWNGPSWSMEAFKESDDIDDQYKLEVSYIAFITKEEFLNVIPKEHEDLENLDKIQVVLNESDLPHVILGLIISAQKTEEKYKVAMDPYLYIYKLLTHPSFQSKGVATKLLDKTIATAEDCDLYQQVLSVSVDNSHAISFYEKNFDFQITSETSNENFIMTRYS